MEFKRAGSKNNRFGSHSAFNSVFLIGVGQDTFLGVIFWRTLIMWFGNYVDRPNICNFDFFRRIFITFEQINIIMKVCRWMSKYLPYKPCKNKIEILIFCRDIVVSLGDYFFGAPCKFLYAVDGQIIPSDFNWTSQKFIVANFTFLNAEYAQKRYIYITKSKKFSGEGLWPSPVGEGAHSLPKPLPLSSPSAARWVAFGDSRHNLQNVPPPQLKNTSSAAVSHPRSLYLSLYQSINQV